VHAGRQPPFHQLVVRNPAPNSAPALRKRYESVDAAERHGAKIYDCTQILLYGPAAETSFPIDRYTKADVTNAIAMLKAAGWNLLESVETAQRYRGLSSYSGVMPIPQANCVLFRATCTWSELNKLRRSPIHVRGMFTSDVEAAREADLGSLLFHGLQAKLLNFPASSYDMQQLSSTYHKLVEWVHGNSQKAPQEDKDKVLDTIRRNWGALKQASHYPTASCGLCKVHVVHPKSSVRCQGGWNLLQQLESAAVAGVGLLW
jgi:hypothetical protein